MSISPDLRRHTWYFLEFPSWSTFLAIVRVCNNLLAYSAHVAIASLTLVILFNRGRCQPGSHTKKLVFFVSMLLLLGTMNAVGYQVSIPNPADQCAGTLWSTSACGWPWTIVNYPVGTFLQDLSSLAITLLAKSYLIYRCSLLWRQPMLIAGMSSLLIMVLGVESTIVAAPHPQFEYAYPPRTERQAELGTRAELSSLFWRLNIVLNVTASIIIIGRILWLGRSRVCTPFPAHNHDNRALCLSGRQRSLSSTLELPAMLIESSLPYTALLVLAAALHGEEGSFTLLPTLVTQTEAIAAELMIMHLVVRSFTGAIDAERGGSLRDECADTRRRVLKVSEESSSPLDQGAQAKKSDIGMSAQESL